MIILLPDFDRHVVADCRIAHKSCLICVLGVFQNILDIRKQLLLEQYDEYLIAPD